jgi:hypothetical protein
MSDSPISTHYAADAPQDSSHSIVLYSTRTVTCYSGYVVPGALGQYSNNMYELSLAKMIDQVTDTDTLYTLKKTTKVRAESSTVLRTSTLLKTYDMQNCNKVSSEE